MAARVARAPEAAEREAGSSWIQEELERQSLDVLLHCGTRHLAQATVSVPSLGAWRLLHGDDDHGLTDVVKGKYITRSRLVRLGTGGDVPIAQAWSATDRRSVRRQRNRLGWNAHAMISRALQSAAGKAASCIESHPSEGVPEEAVDKSTVLPIWRYLYSSVRDAVIDKTQGLVRVEQWGLGITVHPSGEGPLFDAPPQQYVLPPSDRFWADPFPFEHQGRTFVFVEELVYRENKGTISLLELEANRQPSAVRVIEEPHHLSYPHIFEWRGDIFMTPESAAANRVDLYRARRFPEVWEKVDVLIDGVAAVDPTILEIEGSWWMFVNLPLKGAPNTQECHLFWADRLDGPWQPHPCSPVRSDVRCARPAGRLFFKNGRLFRPAQDCSRRYGYAVVVNEVMTLSRTQYRERVVSQIEPNWRPDIVATHTLNHAANITVRDCLLLRSRWTD